MGETAEAELGADEAADLLAGIEDVEEHVTARTVGLTWLVWGTAIPGLLVSYHAAGSLEASRFEWILSVLWIPWIFGASLTTNWLWETTAVHLEREPSSTHGWATSLIFTGLFLVFAGLIVFGARALGVRLLLHEWMLLAGGLLTFAVATLYHQRQVPGVREALAGGLAIALGGALLAAVSWEPVLLEALLAAGLVGGVYYGMGARLVVRG